LKAKLPITYWTFLIGAIAIAGVPGLAGFFSKDEILSRTFAGGHMLLWAIGLVTSLLTAVYMFRVVFLAFHGPSRAASAGSGAHGGAPAHPEEEEPAASAAHPASSHAPSAHDSHGGNGHLHDAPPAMALALIVLAVGSIVAGYVNLPHALGGAGRLERFLEPSFRAQAVAEGPRAGGRGDEAEAAGAAEELELMGVSSLVAAGGIGIAFFFFVSNRRAADETAARFAGLHNVLLHKYYVDEFYEATVVRPIRIVSEEGLWKGVDVRVIDGTVNGVAGVVGGLSQMMRRIQSGSVRVYAASVFLGTVLILGYYLWR